ncbi:MAG: alpha-glucosidase/alpha-galactosidase, partial [Armatimonadetes bacterium]|nr:alpha-glucosidase/alpha-galactosidase [Armatimonadota bacterium]
MAKIAFIGAGSFGFTRTLVKDILTFPLLEDAELALMDVDAEKLDYIKRAVERIVKEGGYPAKVTATTDRRKALKGADAVIITILAGSVQVWRHDIEIPKKFGVDINVGDTRGPSGIFRALRTIPIMVSICKDMEEVCPKALLLNYTNPMAMLCRAMQRESSIVSSGLCHSVQGTVYMMAHWIGAPMTEVNYTCAGINHLSWFVKFLWNGEDAYPKLREVVKRNKKVYNEEHVRNEMFLALGYYVTESSGHNSEYNWWFRKRPDLIEKHCTHGTGWNPGVYADILNGYLAREKSWRKDIQAWLDNPAPLH